MYESCKENYTSNIFFNFYFKDVFCCVTVNKLWNIFCENKCFMSFTFKFLFRYYSPIVFRIFTAPNNLAHFNLLLKSRHNYRMKTEMQQTWIASNKLNSFKLLCTICIVSIWINCGFEYFMEFVWKVLYQHHLIKVSDNSLRDISKCFLWC